jgi:hypothetical protein
MDLDVGRPRFKQKFWSCFSDAVSSVSVHRYEGKLNSLHNFQCGPSITKFLESGGGYEDVCLLGFVPYSFVEFHRRFRSAYCFHHQGALMMELASTSQTSMKFYKTVWRK